MEDLKNRIEDNEKSVMQQTMKSQKKMNTVVQEFESLQSAFKREEEASRVARKTSDNLQEEYCRIVHSVATEKQRNMMYIEKAKREFVTEITAMN